MTDPIAPPPPPPPTGTAVSRLRNKLLHPWSRSKEEAPSQLPMVAPQRPLGFPASVAEFLLVLRLKARRRSSAGADMLERAARVVFVTCKSWFSGAGSKKPPAPKDD